MEQNLLDALQAAWRERHARLCQDPFCTHDKRKEKMSFEDAWGAHNDETEPDWDMNSLLSLLNWWAHEKRMSYTVEIMTYGWGEGEDAFQPRWSVHLRRGRYSRISWDRYSSDDACDAIARAISFLVANDARAISFLVGNEFGESEEVK